MASIYNIDEWDKNSHSYKTHDIVKWGNYFWYCVQDHTSEDTTEKVPSVDDKTYWNGSSNIFAAGIHRTWPYFFWPSSYNITITHQPRIISIQLGDGYEQRMPDGLNHDRLEFALTFEKRPEKEARAIVHFLAARQGYKAFYFKTPAPYGIVKKFVCKSWNSVYVFDDNYTVTATFTEKS